MNKKVLTLCAGFLLAGSLTANAQLVGDDNVATYRSRVLNSAKLDIKETTPDPDPTNDYDLSAVSEINPNYYYQLRVDPNVVANVDPSRPNTDGYFLTAERDYSTGKVYLTVKRDLDAILTHSLWQIKVTNRSANGRVYTFVNKETGYELAYDHTKAVTLEGNGKEVTTLDYAHDAELSGCINHWAWYTTDQDTKTFDYKPLYSYFHNPTDSVMGLALADAANSAKDLSKALDEDNHFFVYPVKDSRAKAGDYLQSEKEGGYNWLKVKPVVAGAKVLTADEINSMADANGSSLSFTGGIADYDDWKKGTNKIPKGATKFTVCKPGTNEPMEFATNPFSKTFTAVQTADEEYRMRLGQYAPYLGYEVLFQANDESGFLYVSEHLFEGLSSSHIYNGLQVTVEPYRVAKEENGEWKVTEYTDYAKVPEEDKKEVNALSARYHWKVTYYPTNDSLVFEPLNASRMSSIDQQQGKKAWEADINKLKKSEWLNTVSQGTSSNASATGNAGSFKEEKVPVALYAMNFGPISGDTKAFLTVGYADGIKNQNVNPGNKAYAAREKGASDNPAFVTTNYQAQMNLVVRFNHSYANEYERTTLDPGLYFINLKGSKADKTQTENRVNGAYLVKDMKDHFVYDTEDDAQEFLHMPATQWVVEQLHCTEGDDVNYNDNPQLIVWNREFNKNSDKPSKAFFVGQLYKNKKTGNIVTLDYRNGGSTGRQTVDHHSQNSKLPAVDEYAFTDITAKQTQFGYFNETDDALRESVFTFRHLQNMQADLYLSEKDGYVKLADADDATEFELYRAAGWVPTQSRKDGTYSFAYADSMQYGYNNKLVKPLYNGIYKLKVKDENLIDNDHKFLAITNQHKYVIATESEIADDDKLTFAFVLLKENNELDGDHAYAIQNYTMDIEALPAVATVKPEALTGLMLETSGTSNKYYKVDAKGNKTYFFTASQEPQVSGKLEVDNVSLYAKLADLCETTTDVFVMQQKDRKLYYKIADDYVNNAKKVLALQTNDGKAYLYEDSSSKLAKANNLNYLAVENKTTTTKNEGFYVDYVAKSRAAMPQYLLAVAADSVRAYTYCSEGKHGINPNCEHTDTLAGYVTGRYLVNFNDSVKRTVIDKLSKRADAFKSSNYVRLGFVEALHQGDTLYVMKDGNKLADWKEGAVDNSGNYIVPAFFNAENNDKIYKKVVLNGKHNNVAFSFRNTGYEDGGFLIESNDIDNEYAQIGSFAGAWIKIHNNVPVLAQFTNNNGNHNTGDSTDSWKQYTDYTTANTFGEVINQAAIFNAEFMTKDASATANEAISTSDVTVAATTGAVIVKGAAGKSVVINNILGQTLATAVLASDNATIAVPAGVAVVAVEGEEAVKVVVK